MKLTEAIERNTLLIRHGGWLGNKDNVAAIKLGKEALTLYARCRNTQPVWLPIKLPSETFE